MSCIYRRTYLQAFDWGVPHAKEVLLILCHHAYDWRWCPEKGEEVAV